MSHLAKSLILAVCTSCSIHLPAQDFQKTVPKAQSEVAEVVHVTGLMEVKADVRGSLQISATEVIFSNKDARATIPRNQIVNVFVGDERTEPWGTTGKIARKVIPFGGGAALGAVSSGQVDLLTVESLDEHGGYHGVVFTVPFQKAAAIRTQLTANLTPPSVIRPASCPVGQENPRSILLAPIAVTGVALPDEYRILLYEQLYKELKMRQPNDTFLRAGDLATGAGCTELTLHVTVEGFKKGNRAVRASTGPLGLFLGTTSLSFEINLQDVDNETVFNAQMKKSDRSDSDSLGLADAIAKSVSKRMDKEMKRRAPKRTSGPAASAA